MEEQVPHEIKPRRSRHRLETALAQQPLFGRPSLAVSCLCS